MALARAFLRDAPLVILDEPTASLDPASEDLVQAGIDDLAAGRTLLVVAHRLRTVRRADRILVLDAGRVVESGGHAGLMAADGPYRRLVIGLRGGGMKDLLAPAPDSSRPTGDGWPWGPCSALLTLVANVTLMATSGWFIAAMAVAGAAGVSMNYFTPAALVRAAAPSCALWGAIWSVW